MVTLTKPYYMAEHPVTEEMYAAVMGNDPSTVKTPTMPVFNVDCAGMYKFCDLLSAKIGCKVRIPTAAEWEYAARVGTSNPTFREKYVAQNSNADAKYMSLPLPVKSKVANAWGFYDMHSGGWEKVSDAPVVERQDAVDPVHIPPQDRNEATRSRNHKHFGKGQWTCEISEVEFIGSQGGRFRIVVETEPAAAEPAAK
jgi:formylglycine-generating enzyme required for sulfatase activity